MTDDSRILEQQEAWPAGHPELAVLHAVALHELAWPDQLAQLLGADGTAVGQWLGRATERGEVNEVSGRYRTTVRGRHRLQQEYPTAWRALRDDPHAHAAFARFELLNQRLLAVLLDWQTVAVGSARVGNDHSDARHDARVLDRLHRIVEQTHAALEPWARHDPLPRRFLDRCSEALDEADAGDLRYVSGAEIASLHTLWFQLHEHLLRALGRDRTSASSG